MQRYRRVEVVEAMQFDGMNAVAIGEWLGQRTSATGDGGYMSVWAVGQAAVHADKGEWVTQNGDGRIVVYANVSFRAVFQVLGDLPHKE